MKKPSKSQEMARVNLGTTDEVWAKRYPRIVEYLTTDQWEGGEARETSALSISIKDGSFALALNDKDLHQSLYTQAGTLAEALKLMEGALESGAGVWRPWKSGKRK